jgi:hypothetical protein
MSEAKRKREAGPPYHYELVRISGAVMTMMIAQDHPELLDYLQLIARTVTWMHDRSRKPALCITCEHAFGYDELPEEFIVCAPITLAGKMPHICNALCARCALDPHILERIAAVYRESGIFGDDIKVTGHSNLGLDEWRQ